MKLKLECLESRLAPAAYVWYGTTNTDYNTASNWKINNVAAVMAPGYSDDVTFDSNGGTNNCQISFGNTGKCRTITAFAAYGGDLKISGDLNVFGASNGDISYITDTVYLKPTGKIQLGQGFFDLKKTITEEGGDLGSGKIYQGYGGTLWVNTVDNNVTISANVYVGAAINSLTGLSNATTGRLMIDLKSHNYYAYGNIDNYQNGTIEIYCDNAMGDHIIGVTSDTCSNGGLWVVKGGSSKVYFEMIAHNVSLPGGDFTGGGLGVITIGGGGGGESPPPVYGTFRMEDSTTIIFSEPDLNNNAFLSYGGLVQLGDAAHMDASMGLNCETIKLVSTEVETYVTGSLSVMPSFDAYVLLDNSIVSGNYGNNNPFRATKWQFTNYSVFYAWANSDNHDESFRLVSDRSLVFDSTSWVEVVFTGSCTDLIGPNQWRIIDAFNIPDPISVSVSYDPIFGPPVEDFVPEPYHWSWYRQEDDIFGIPNYPTYWLQLAE